MFLIGLLFTSFVSGMTGDLLVRYLTSPPLQMSKYLFLTSLFGFIDISILNFFAVSIGSVEFFLGLFVAVVFFLAGYWWRTKLFLSREDSRPVPAITRTKDDPGLGHTAIIYFTHGEPETFDPIGWINQFREFDEQGIKFVPTLIRPIFIYKLREKYLNVGKSNHCMMHHQMFKSLQNRYHIPGERNLKFYLCFLDDYPRPDAAVIQALNDGASKIVVAEVFLTISNHTAEGKELIEETGIHDYNVKLKFTGPMYDSDILKDMYVERANAHLNGVPKEETGILLVGHGQPHEWDEEWPTLTEQEIGFRQDILDRFARDGYKRDNMSLAWMMFKEPKPGPKIEEWVAKGLSQVIYIPAAISADAIHSQADIPELVEAANVPPDFPRINLGAWNDDPMTITAIKAKIDAQLNLSS